MNKIFSTSLLGLVAIFIASFGDEIASVTFAFAQVDAKSMGGVSFLISSALIGGLTAGPVSIYLLNKFEPRRILLFLFILAGLTVIASTSFYKQKYCVYLVSFILGCLGSCFWSVLSVLIPNSFEEKALLNINKVVQSIRNSGYILGPAFAGLLSIHCTLPISLIIVGLIFLFASPFTQTIFHKKGSNLRATIHREGVIAIPHIRPFFRLKGMRSALLPLIIAACMISTFNVAFIHMLLVEIQYSEVAYGTLISVFSLGLVLGPIALASVVEKSGTVFGASVSAATMGLSMVLIGLYQAPIWLLFVLLVFGLANGVHNTLLSTFVMKTVPQEKRNELMPTYLFILQLSILAGFLLGGFVPTQHARLLLIVAGAIASLAGLIGVIGNRKESLVWNSCSVKIPADI